MKELRVSRQKKDRSKKRKRKKNSLSPSPSTIKQTGWYLGLHHIVPSSRGGGNSLSNMYPRERWEEYDSKHQAWHTLFVNMTPEEASSVIAPYAERDGELDEKFFHLSFSVEEELREGRIQWVVKIQKNKSKRDKKKAAWQTLFGEISAREVMSWIEREFIQKAWYGEPRASS